MASNELQIPVLQKRKKAAIRPQNGSPGDHARLAVRKTYKLYIAGQFVRSESGRYLKHSHKKDSGQYTVCRASRKDFRNAVVAARKAQPVWQGCNAFLRGQILYRIAENLESRQAQFSALLEMCGSSATAAREEFSLAVDRLVYYAGWCDKYIQLFSSVNPVSGPYFNFSYPEPTGVAALATPEKHGLLGLVSVIAPALAGGNTVVVLAGSRPGPVACDFAEVVHGSDVPSGVVNLLTGDYDELLPHLSSHMDVNAILYCGEEAGRLKAISTNAALNIKRVLFWKFSETADPDQQSPYKIMDLQEIKTTWHPVGV